MRFPWTTPAASTRTPRRPRRMGFTWDSLERRAVLSHVGAFHNLHGAAQVGSVTSAAITTHTGFGHGSGSSSTSSNSALTTAQQTLRNDAQTILGASGTTVAQLTAIRTTSQTLRTDGLTPTSRSALQTFENSLVTSFANGTSLTDGTLLAQYEALYTPTGTTLTTQQTTDLTSAYNALVAAVTSSNITAANITTIDNDYAAVLAAQGSTSTATYPYFSLVTGGQGRLGGGGCH